MSRVFRRRFTRRGVSVIIAALLLIAIAVAAAVLLYVFSIGLLGSLSSSGGQQMKEQLIMEAYDWTGATLLVTVKNVGSVSITIQSGDWFLNGMTAVPSAGCTTSLAIGQKCQATLPMPTGFTPTSGVAYALKITTPDGGAFAYAAVKGLAT